MRVFRMVAGIFIVVGIMMLLAPVFAQTTITLTPAQVNQVLADNPCEECPDPPIDPPPIDPPIDPPSECQDSDWDSWIYGWTNVFYAAWPNPTYQNVTNKNVPRYGYYAIVFSTGDEPPTSGKLSLLENPHSPGIRVGSISECKGDFDVVQSCKKTWGLGGGIDWSTSGKVGACQLKTNTRYYFNVTFTDGEDNTRSNCLGEPCRINIQTTHL